MSQKSRTQTNTAKFTWKSYSRGTQAGISEYYTSAETPLPSSLVMAVTFLVAQRSCLNIKLCLSTAVTLSSINPGSHVPCFM